LSRDVEHTFFVTFCPFFATLFDKPAPVLAPAFFYIGVLVLRPSQAYCSMPESAHEFQACQRRRRNSGRGRAAKRDTYWYGNHCGEYVLICGVELVEDAKRWVSYVLLLVAAAAWWARRKKFELWDRLEGLACDR